MTFSIVAYDPDENAWGVAVASKFLAVGAMVCFAKSGAGAVATQSYAKMSFGPDGLMMLSSGRTAAETLTLLLAADPGREKRQVGIVDSQGNVAAHTGKDCHGWAGHLAGQGFSCQGNILAGGNVVQAMAEAFSGAKGELADRLVTALEAGDEAGGDKRGRQGAAVMVVAPNQGYGGDNDRYVDLRVDDDLRPIVKLRDLLESHHLFFGASKSEDQIHIDEPLARELQRMMLTQGYMGGEIDGIWDEAAIQAFWVMVGNENLEERWTPENNPGYLDRIALEYLRKRFG